VVAEERRAVDRTGHIHCRLILGRLHHQYGRIYGVERTLRS
jgi:hypothetical protein